MQLVEQGKITSHWKILNNWDPVTAALESPVTKYQIEMSKLFPKTEKSLQDDVDGTFKETMLECVQTTTSKASASDAGTARLASKQKRPSTGPPSAPR